jgi:sigma-E factor negative regulatory protein RseC
VYDKMPERWSVGDTVNVCGSLSMGKKAVRLAFGMPVLLIILTLLVAKLLLNLNDGLSILFIVVVLGAYFALMYALREKMEKTFVMWIEKV